MEFEHRIAMVNGGGNGIGRELVRQLAEQGCHVALCDVDAAGISGGQSFLRDEHARRDRTFGTCGGGMYCGWRAAPGTLSSPS